VLDSPGPEYAKVYRICIELTALKGLLPSQVLQSLVPGLDDHDGLERYLESPSTRETWLYACFEYPLLFGSAHIFSNPTPFVRRTNDGRTMTIVKKPELGGSTFSFDFAMSERNLSVALRECKLGVEIWRMASAPLRTGETAHRAPEDEFVGQAVVPLAAVVGQQAKRQSLSEGQVAFHVHDYFAIHSETLSADKNPFRKAAIGHVGVRLQLNDLGAFDTARSREQRLREEVRAVRSFLSCSSLTALQLDTTRAKLEELWEEYQKANKRADKAETRLLVAEFEEQIRDTQDREELQKVCVFVQRPVLQWLTRWRDKAKQAQIERLRNTEAKLKNMEELNKEAIAALEDTERTALQEQRRRLALQRENDELRSRLAQLSLIACGHRSSGCSLSPLLEALR
jgi:hypothetical protein